MTRTGSKLSLLRDENVKWTGTVHDQKWFRSFGRSFREEIWDEPVLTGTFAVRIKIFLQKLWTNIQTMECRKSVNKKIGGVVPT